MIDRCNRKSLFTIHATTMVLVLFVMTTCACADNLTAPVTFSNTSSIVTVTSGGRLGIGTMTPATPLHVLDSNLTAERGIMTAQHNDGAQGANLVFRKSRNTEAAPQELVCPDPVTGLCDYIGSLTVMGWNKLNYERSAQIGFRLDAAPYADPDNAGALLNPTAITFVVGSSRPTLHEAMRITSSGKVGIGTDKPSALLELRNGGLRINNDAALDQPNCDETTRGLIWMIKDDVSGDKIQVCIKTKSADGTIIWKSVVLNGNN